MNKRDLTKILRKEYGFSWRYSKSIIDIILESIKKELQLGEKVILNNFGTFSIKEHAPRKYRDISTGRVRMTNSKYKVKFNPSDNILLS